MPGRRRRAGSGARTLLVAGAALTALTAAVAGVAAVRSGPGTAGARPAPAPAATVTDHGTAGCADPSTGLEWRVDWRLAGGTGGVPLVVPTGFGSRRVALPPAGAGGTAATGAAPTTPPGGTPADAGAWTSRDSEAWSMRWTPTSAVALSGPERSVAERRGNRSELAAHPVERRFSPRFVSPDGGCTVYVAPFATGPAGGARVAVAGDSLMAQVALEAPGGRYGTGPLPRRLEARGLRPEVSGQGGRAWTYPPGPVPGLDRADLVLTDELRGLRAAGADTLVVALGTNDAGWVSLAPDAAQFELRLAWALVRLEPVLDEIAESGRCTVLVTVGDRNAQYLTGDPLRYAVAAGRINDELRRRAAFDGRDGVRLWDWAAVSAPHRSGDPVPWFGPDTIHLNETGRSVYADGLAAASGLCDP